MKYRFLFLIVLLLVSVFGYADRMMDIMQGYNAKTMSLAEMDSVLEAYPQPLPEGKGVSVRYKLEYKNQQAEGHGLSRGHCLDPRGLGSHRRGRSVTRTHSAAP